jgi:uncharacterized protein (UPF0548 family)
VTIGAGDECWFLSRELLLDWAVKTRTGFDVAAVDGGIPRVEEGRDYVLTAGRALAIREPVRVVAVVDERDRCGFAYGTRSGHPVSGEEAFILTRAADGRVRLTMRSVTYAASGRWRLAFPALLIAQRYYRRRYRRALVC